MECETNEIYKSYILNIKLFIIERHSNNDVFLLWKIKENNII